MKLDFETMSEVMRDISLDRPPEKSKLRYTPEMLVWRKKQEQQWAEHKKKNPNAVIFIPSGS